MGGSKGTHTHTHTYTIQPKVRIYRKEKHIEYVSTIFERMKLQLIEVKLVEFCTGLASGRGDFEFSVFFFFSYFI